MRGRPLCAVFAALIGLIMVFKIFGIPFWGERRFGDEALDIIAKSDELSVSGRVVSRSKYDDGISYLISDAVIHADGSRLQAGSILLYFKNTNTDLKIDAQVEARGKLSLYENARNEGGFDSYDYYAGEDRYFKMNCSEVRVLSCPEFSIARMLSELREKMKETLVYGAGEESGGILAAMMLGDRTGVSDETSLDYSSAGLSHLLSISGLHVSLIGLGILGFLKKILDNKFVPAVISILFLGVYTVFTGSRESTVRAFIMFAVMAAGKCILRSYDSVSALSFAGILILIIRPSGLFRAGFQFSFAAAFGAAVLCPILIKRTGIELYGRGRLRSTLLSAAMVWISVQITTVPVMLWHYYEFPVLSILPNMIFVPVMSLVMMLGFLGVFAGMIFPDAARLILFIPGSLTRIMGDTGAFLRNIPFYSYVTGRPHWIQILLYAAGLILFAAALSRKGRFGSLNKKMLLGALPAMAFVFINLRSGFSITALDIGQGDSLVIQYNRKCFLVDSGSSSQKEIASDILIPYLKYHGITKVDGIFISHADSDHISGISELLEMVRDRETRMEIGSLILPEVLQNNDSAKKVVSLAEDTADRILYVKSGDRFSAGELNMDILYPGIYGTGDSNEDSMVMTVSYGDFTMIFTGDIEGEAEQKLAEKVPRCDVLKVAHHGSSGSSSEEFLSAVSPTSALISCGRNNVYGHPHQETLERLQETGAEIFCTAENGEITVSAGSGGNYQIQTMIQGGVFHLLKPQKGRL